MAKQKDCYPSSNIFLDKEKLEQTNHFNYLGTLVTSEFGCDKEISRIVLVKKAYREKNILKGKDRNIMVWLTKEEVGSCRNGVLLQNDANI